MLTHPTVDKLLQLRCAGMAKHQACIEDVDFRHRRGLDRQLVLSLAAGRWVREHLNVLICGLVAAT